MFEVGDRVVCVDDGLDDSWQDIYLAEISAQLHKGQVYTVTWVGPQWHVWDDGTTSECNGVGICLAEISFSDPDDCLDAWRFRKIRDISQSLRELKELAINCPALADAGVRGGRG